MTSPKPCRDAGLSLIELVVAMAVFAMVAVMGLQSLAGMTRGQAVLEQRATAQMALHTGLSRLKADMSSVAPVLFFAPTPEAPRSAIRLSQGGRVLALNLSGQTEVAGQMQRAEWHFDAEAGTLSRALWQSTIPADTTAYLPPQPVLTGVRDMQVRSFWQGNGWQSGVAQPGTGGSVTVDGDDASIGAVFSDTLPLALEITLEFERFGTIPLVMSLQ